MTQSILKNYAYTMLRIQIILHQYVFSCPLFIKIILFLLYQLQSLTFLKFDNQEEYNIIIVLKQILRPDKIYDLSKYGFLFPFLFFIVFDIIILQLLTIRYFLNPPQGKTPNNQLDSKTPIISFFIALASLFSQFSLTYLYIPIQGSGLFSIRYNILNNEYGNAVAGLFGIVLFDMAFLLKKILCTTTLNLQIQGFEQIELGKIHFLQQMIIRTQLILIESADIDNNTIQAILVIVYALTELYNQLYNQAYIHKIYSGILIYCQSFVITFCIFNFTNILGMSYLVFPLLATILYQINSSITNNYLQTIQKTKDEIKIRYFLISYINQQVRFQSQKYKILEAILSHQHIQKCDQVTCDCKLIPRTDEITKICLLSDSLLRRFFFTKLYHWNLVLTQQNESNYIQYLAACIQFDFSTTAFQECNRVLHYEQRANSMGFMSSRESTNNRSDSLSKGSTISRKHTKKLIKLRSGINNISKYSQEKVKILLDVVRLNLNQNFYSKQNKNQEDMTIGIKLFMESEVKNEKLKEEIIKAIRSKLQFYQQLQTNNSMVGNSLFNKSKGLSQRLEKLEVQLLKQYEQFPSQKLQSINCFVQAELMNNYLKAFKIQTLTTISDEKLLNMRKMIKVNLFGKNVVYLIVQLSDNLSSMKILKHSNQAHKFFNYRSHEFQKNQFIDFLLPNAVKEQHCLLVQQFLLTGESKYFRNMEHNFILQQEGLIKPINFFFDLNTGYTEDLSFVAFFEENNIMNGYILVNVNEIIGDISYKLLELQGWKASEIKNNYENIITAYQIPISTVLPKFHQYIELKKDHHKIYDAQMQLIDKLTLNQQSRLGQRAIRDIWTESTLGYSATISIFQREIYGINYYIIEIEDLKSSGWKSCYSSNRTEAEDIQIPTEVESESIANHPQELEVCMQSQGFVGHNQADEDVAENSQYQQYKIVYQDISANQSSFIKSATALMNKQQKFFEAQKDVLSYEKSISQSESLSKIQNVNQFYEVDLNKIDKEMRENIRMQLQLDNDEQEQQIDDQASQVSSLIGVRRSIFYKKYEVIQKVISKDKKPKEMFIYNAILTLYFILTAINCIVIIVNTEQDMNRFLQEIDMILLHSSFMTPFDTFMMFRFQLINYSNQLRLRLISTDEYNYIYNWDMDQMGFGYTDMKESFNFQLQNPYMKEFFVDETNDVYFQGASQNDIYLQTISLRESLFQLMQAQFAYNVARVKGTSITNIPFQTYLTANYLNFHDRLQQTTDKIMNYTQNRKQQVQEKWLIVWIPFLIITVLLIALGYKVYLNYLIIYEEYLDLFKYANKTWVEKEMDRYKVLLSILSADSETMFKYQYNLESKEKFMLSENYNNEAKGQKGREMAKRQHQKGQQKISKILSFLLFTLIMVIYFIITLQIEIQTNSYLNKYSETASVYKLFGDTNFRVSEVYAFRSLLYYWYFYPYYTDNDRTRMLNRLYYAISMLQEFNVQFQQFGTKNYLTDSSLLNLLDRLTHENVCYTLTQEQYESYSYFCDRAFDGTLSKSMVNAINYITNFMTTEISINNFTSIVSYYKYEAEGAYVLVNVLKNVVNSLKNGLLSGTEAHMNQVITLSILYICITVVAMILQFTLIWTFFEIEYFLVKRFVLLLPSAVLLLDDNLERRIRQIQSNI